MSRMSSLFKSKHVCRYQCQCREDIEIDNDILHFPMGPFYLSDKRETGNTEEEKNEWAKSARAPRVTAIGGGGKTESKILIGKVVGKNTLDALRDGEREIEDSSGTRRDTRTHRATR